MKVSISFGVLLALAFVSKATKAESLYYGPEQKHYAPVYYSYGYGVRDSYNYADYGQEESRKGENTKGQYTVLLPDGRRQVVTYYVNGHSGFVADVKYLGVAKYDHYKPEPYYKQY